MQECLKIIQSLVGRPEKSATALDAEIEKTCKRLEVKLPTPLVEFYTQFGNQAEILHSFFEFEPLEKIRIDNEALIFCHGHQGEKSFGILLSDLGKANPPVKLMRPGENKWFSACIFATSFLVNMAGWQGVNAMPSVAKAAIVEGALKSKMENYLSPISKEKSIFLGFNFYTYYSLERKILASYARDLGELYLASKDDQFLSEFESEIGMEFDWL